MPSKSKAQFRKMGELYSQGKITRAQLEDFNKGADYQNLPEHVAPKVSSTVANPLNGTRRPRNR
jgi:hypothetical protein